MTIEDALLQAGREAGALLRRRLPATCGYIVIVADGSPYGMSRWLKNIPRENAIELLRQVAADLEAIEEQPS